jgi:hypothetical protein
MTHSQLSDCIANRTGESISVIRRLGFQLKSQPHQEPSAEDICLVVYCPSCCGQVPYPGRARDGSTALAECVACDIYFPFEDRDVFPASARRDRFWIERTAMEPPRPLMKRRDSGGRAPRVSPSRDCQTFTVRAGAILQDTAPQRSSHQGRRSNKPPLSRSMVARSRRKFSSMSPLPDG